MPERVFRNLAYLNGLSITGTNTRVKDVMFYLPVKMDDGDVKMFTGLNTITLEVLAKAVWWSYLNIIFSGGDAKA